jgi:hypothetical protein
MLPIGRRESARRPEPSSLRVGAIGSTWPWVAHWVAHFYNALPSKQLVILGFFPSSSAVAHKSRLGYESHLGCKLRPKCHSYT